ncbi:MAG: GNAT family N-acetyltransferase [Proteobacteria bacterium]|nr:GNAT family N-acetyltransferase [Pseudomonadota bacterium]MBI3497865.1 GNAT family N-acetyltransferase [Pseudomonadota bacterium]
MTDHARIRPARAEDLPAILALNDAAIPHVSAIKQSPLDGPKAGENIFLAAIRDERPVGFLLAMTPDADYDSPNFLWFRERGRDLLYVDRIVVEPGLRGSGIGRRLYACAAAMAPKHLVRIGCEVNLQPPNPESLRFHTRIGFREVGRQAFVPGEKEVVYLACEGERLVALKTAADSTP